VSGGYVADERALADTLSLVRREASRVTDTERSRIVLVLPPLATLDRLVGVSSRGNLAIEREVRKVFGKVFADLRPYRVVWSKTASEACGARVYASLCRKDTIRSYSRVLAQAGFTSVTLVPYAVGRISRAPRSGPATVSFDEGDGVRKTIILQDGLPVRMDLAMGPCEPGRTPERSEPAAALDTTLFGDRCGARWSSLHTVFIAAVLVVEVLAFGQWYRTIQTHVRSLEGLAITRAGQADAGASVQSPVTWPDIYKALPETPSGVVIDACTLVPPAQIQLSGEGRLADICSLESQMSLAWFSGCRISSLQRKGDLYSFVITARLGGTARR
jgi:hypothetical protein